MNSVKLSLILFAISLAFVIGCSSSKKSGKKGFIGQAYHNTTARYNRYYNADLLLNGVYNNVKQSGKEDYGSLLAIYPERNPEAAKSYASDLDEIIKKASLSIQRHETSKWVDDCYMLIGQAYYLKADYNSALDVFRYVASNFQPEELKESGSSKSKKSSSKKKKKKKKGKKKSSAKKSKLKSLKQAEQPEEEKPHDAGFIAFLKHQPVNFEAMIWVVNTYTALGKYKEAATVITLIRAEKSLPKKLRDDLELAEADLYITQKAYDRAIPPLLKAIEYTRRKRHRARLHFIAGQLYELAGKADQAIEQFNLVLESKPLYELEFNAKMKIADLTARGGGSSTDEVRKLLTKMLKDEKNIDYLDQIYYALAKLDLKENKKTQAIEHLKKAIRHSTTNTQQKAMAYLQIGEIYFQDELYSKAQPYYDSTLALLNQDYPRYNEIKSLNETLDALVKNYEIIEQQDSLLLLASLDEESRNKAIDKIIKREQKKLEKQKQKELEKQSVETDPFFNETATSKTQENKSNTKGAWYFYNPSTKATGYNDFIKKWGVRKLEDNWRRKEKTTFDESLTTENASDENEDVSTLSAEAFTSKENLLKSLPLTSEQQEQAKGKIVNAYFNIANIYKNKLHNNAKAIETYEELLNRFPGNEKELETLYNLYILYSQSGNQAKAEYYKQQILSKYPGSKIAMYIKNPEFLKTAEKEQQQLEEYYSQTYMLFINGQYEEALTRIEAAQEKFPNNPLLPKFNLLKAMITGHLQDLDTYIAALENVIKEYPYNEVGVKAREMLAILKKAKPQSPVQTDTTDHELLEVTTETFGNSENAEEEPLLFTIYDYNPDTLHHAMIYYTEKSVKTPYLVNAVSQFVSKNYSLENLKTRSLLITKDDKVVLIEGFENHQKAKAFLDHLSSDEKFNTNFDTGKLSFYTISDKNLKTLVIDRNFQAYQRFYLSKYKE